MYIFLIFWGNITLLSLLATPIYIPTGNAGEFSFSTPSRQNLLSFVFLMIAILMGVSPRGGSGLIPMWGKSPGEENGSLTPVFLPVEFHGQKSLVCCSPWGGRVRHNPANDTHTHQHSKKKKNWWFWTVVLHKTWESLGLQRDQTSQS